MGYTWVNPVGTRPKKAVASEIGTALGAVKDKMNVTKNKIHSYGPNVQTYGVGNWGGWCDKECSSRGSSVMNQTKINELINLAGCNSRKVKYADLQNIRERSDAVDDDQYNVSTNPKGIWYDNIRNKCIAKNFTDVFMKCSDYGSHNWEAISEAAYKGNTKHQCAAYYSANRWDYHTYVYGSHWSWDDTSDLNAVYSSNVGYYTGWCQSYKRD